MRVSLHYQAELIKGGGYQHGHKVFDHLKTPFSADPIRKNKTNTRKRHLCLPHPDACKGN